MLNLFLFDFICFYLILFVFISAFPVGDVVFTVNGNVNCFLAGGDAGSAGSAGGVGGASIASMLRTPIELLAGNHFFIIFGPKS